MIENTSKILKRRLIDIHLTIFAMVLISDTNHVTNDCGSNFICENVFIFLTYDTHVAIGIDSDIHAIYI